MPPGHAPVGVFADLRRRDHISAVLNGAGPKKHLPMGTPGGHGEGRGDEQDRGARQSVVAVKMREAQIITDRQRQWPKGAVGQHGLGAGRVAVGFACFWAPVEENVEEVDLVVACHDLARRVHQYAVVQIAAVARLDGARPRMDPDSKARGLFATRIDIGVIGFARDLGPCMGPVAIHQPRRLGHRQHHCPIRRRPRRRRPQRINIHGMRVVRIRLCHGHAECFQHPFPLQIMSSFVAFAPEIKRTKNLEPVCFSNSIAGMPPARRLPSLTALRALEAVRETGSVSAAARRLSVSHSAISHQIKYLEGWIGRPITVRRGRSVALTEAGESLARVVNSSFDAIRHEIDLLPLRFTRAVSISALPIIAQEILLPRLADFRTAHPETSLHISLSQTDQPKTPEPDIEILFRRRDQLLHEHRVFMTGDATPVCAPVLLQAAGGDPIQAVRRGPLLLDEDSRMWSDWLALAGDEWSSEAGAQSLYLEGSFLLQKAAEDGLGVAICRRATTRRAIARGTLIELSQTAMDQDWVYALRIAATREIEPEVRRVVDWLDGIEAGL